MERGRGRRGNDLTRQERVELNKSLNEEFRRSTRLYGQQLRTVNENVVGTVQTHFPSLINSMNLYTVREAKLRDAGDVMVKSIERFSEHETGAGKGGLEAFAECFKEIQDKRHEHVMNLERLYEYLYKYETKCKETAKIAKNGFADQVKELKKSMNDRRRSATRKTLAKQLATKKNEEVDEQEEVEEQVEIEKTTMHWESEETKNSSQRVLPRRRVIRKPEKDETDSDTSDSSDSSDSDSDSSSDSDDSEEEEEENDSLEEVYDAIKEFERDKITDMKFVLGEMIMSEMNFFSQALQKLTDGYQTVMNIDEDDYVEQINQTLNFTAHGISRIPI